MNLPGRPIGSIPVYRIVTVLFKIIFRVNGGYRALHPERVPETGGVIVCPVHISHLDPPAVALGMPHRRLLALGKEELWRNRWFGKVISAIGAFPIRRGDGDSAAIRLAVDLVVEGHALLVFPEGTRGDGARLLPFQPGAAMMAKRTGRPVLPVGIAGTRDILPSGGGPRFSRRGVTVSYGEPMTWAEHGGEGRDAFLTELRHRVAQACHEAGTLMDV